MSTATTQFIEIPIGTRSAHCRRAERRRASRTPCVNCGDPRPSTRRRGHCPACAEYLRRTGSERPARLHTTAVA